MKFNTQLRHELSEYLKVQLGSTVEHVFDSWLMIDADEETPAVMVYLDDGELTTEYMDQGERHEGTLIVSIYMGSGKQDRDLDVIGELIKEAIPLGFRIPNLARFYRSGFSYERSDTGAYRALHLNHQYKPE